MSVAAQAQCKSVDEIAGDFEAWGAVLGCELNVQKSHIGATDANRGHVFKGRILEQRLNR
jgi:hypothetical protein